MPPRESNYWLETVPYRAEHDAGPLPPQVDVAVVGAGYTGLAAALALARSGATVAVVDTHGIGWGASSRNGGMVLSGLKLGAGELVSRYGEERAARMFAASLSAIDCVAEIVRREALECDFVRSGHLEVACKLAHWAAFTRAAELSARYFDHTQRLVSADQLGDEIGSGLYFGGLVDDASATINPARYVHQLGGAARRAGVRIYDNAELRAVEKAPGGFRLTTARGELRADQVVAATGAYTGRSTPGLRRRVVPIGSYIIATDVLAHELADDIIPVRRAIFDSMNFLHYFRLTPDRRLIFGGRAGFYPESPNTVRVSAEILARTMVKVFPQLRNTQVAFAWGGTLDFCFDMMPHVGQIGGVWYALGYAGHGVALATYLGEAIAQMITSGTAGDNPFADLSLPAAPLGLYDGRPWFLPFAEVWYKLLDRFS
jgi:glycine/D-amino acid oxidase-like deaminating enzyme